MASRRGSSLFVALLLALPASVPAGNEATLLKPREGFRAVDRASLPASSFLGGMTYSPGGDPIIYVRGALLRLREGEPMLLASFEEAPFGSFVVLSPDQEAVIFGENTQGKVFRVPLSGGEPLLIDELPRNYDLVFDERGRGFVSASPDSQQVFLLDQDPSLPNRAVIVSIPGQSGPLAVDPEGNLYYGTADFSGDPARQSLHRFTAAQLDEATSGDPLDFIEGELLLEEFPGFSDMVWHEERIYASDLGFGTGLGHVLTIDLARGFAVEEFASLPFAEGIVSPSFLAISPGVKPFVPGSGTPGGRLLVAYSDFQTVNRVGEVAPELHFARGRVNDDQEINLTDAVAILGFLFRGDRRPEVLEAADVNGEGTVDISDAVYLLNFLFTGGPEPPPPFPLPGPAP